MNPGSLLYMKVRIYYLLLDNETPFHWNVFGNVWPAIIEAQQEIHKS